MTTTAAQIIKRSLAVKDEYNSVNNPFELLGALYPRVRICYSNPKLGGHTGRCLSTTRLSRLIRARTTQR